MEDKKNNKLRSRREFFKKAAKGALPILGAIVLANMPVVAKAVEGSMGCNYNCSGTCKGNCSGTCEGDCKTTCYTGCYATCKKTCDYTSKS